METDYLRQLADEGEKQEWYGPGAAIIEALRAAADRIDLLTSLLTSEACTIREGAEFSQSQWKRIGELERENADVRAENKKLNERCDRLFWQST